MIPEPKFKPRDMAKFRLEPRAIVSTVAQAHDNQPVVVLRQPTHINRDYQLYLVMAVDGEQFVANDRELTPLQE